MCKKVTIHFDDGSIITINNVVGSETLGDGFSVVTPDETYIINYARTLYTVIKEEVQVHATD